MADNDVIENIVLFEKPNAFVIASNSQIPLMKKISTVHLNKNLVQLLYNFKVKYIKTIF